MPVSPATKSEPSAVTAPTLDASAYRRFLLFAGLLVVCFAVPFCELVRVAFERDLFSHVVLIPFITGYLVWMRRTTLTRSPAGIRWPGAVLVVLGLILTLAAAFHPAQGTFASGAVALPARLLAFCLFLWGGGFLFLGGAVMRQVLFPALFLLFMIPFPPAMVDAIEAFLQHTSAEVAYLFVQWAGIPVFRTGLLFDMPGLSIRVAPECSGIRSSLVLFITSLLAAHLFLRTRWKQLALVLLVVPLGIARNGFRILVISWLCVNVDPAYIHSPIHKQGGPLFFVLSLIPFSIVLLLLIKTDRTRRSQ